MRVSRNGWLTVPPHTVAPGGQRLIASMRVVVVVVLVVVVALVGG